MAQSIEIHYFKLSLIWFDINLNLLGDPDPPTVPMGFLGYRDSYAKAFDDVLNGKNIMGLTAPWEHRPGQHFWQYYVGKSSLADFNGIKAWKYIVPFRHKLPVSLTASWLNGSVTPEVFLYPFGFALIITVDSREHQALRDTIELSFKVREGNFSANWQGMAQEEYKIYQLAEECLSYIRKEAFGSSTRQSMIILNEPFTIFTVIQGTGADFSEPPIQDGEIHCALEAVTTWNRALLRLWAKTKLPKLDQNIMVPLKFGPQGHLVYAQKRGRAVWFPEPFTDDDPERRTLSCYHRNLLRLSMQVESLCSFVRITSKKIQDGLYDRLPSMHRECVRIAAGILGRMYGDVDDTYRSMSPRYYIRQNEIIQDINKVRDQVGLQPLKDS